jgi:hypothetical protein
MIPRADDRGGQISRQRRPFGLKAVNTDWNKGTGSKRERTANAHICRAADPPDYDLVPEGPEDNKAEFHC